MITPRRLEQFDVKSARNAQNPVKARRVITSAFCTTVSLRLEARLLTEFLESRGF
jgi:hypothetical protein